MTTTNHHILMLFVHLSRAVIDERDDVPSITEILFLAIKQRGNDRKCLIGGFRVQLRAVSRLGWIY
jgi:hypothetical protein